MSPERRRYPRYPQSLSVELKTRSGVARLLTDNVSRNGAFLITDSPRAQRELLHLRFNLPGGESVEIMGMVRRRELPGAGPAVAAPPRRPGMGVEFYAMSEAARQVWDHFVLGLEGHAVPGPADPPAAPTRRRHPRYVSRFLVRLKDRQRLVEFFTKDIGGGGTFLRTPAPRQVSTEVELVLVHPRTQKEFPLAGHVVRVVEEGSVEERGVGVAFEELPPDRQASLLVFIETGVSHLEQADGTRGYRVELLSEAVSSMEDSPLALLRLGEALLQEIEATAAVEAFRRVLARDPESLAAHRGLFKAYTMLGETEQAQVHLDWLRRTEEHR